MAFRQERSSSRTRGTSSGRASAPRSAGTGRDRSDSDRGRGRTESDRGRGRAEDNRGRSRTDDNRERGRNESDRSRGVAPVRDGRARSSSGRTQTDELLQSVPRSRRGGKPLGPKSRGKAADGGVERSAVRSRAPQDKERQGQSRPGRGAAFESPEEAVNASLIVGRHPVLEALKSGRSINKVMVAQTAEGGSLPEIVGKAKALGVVVQTVPKAHLDEIAAGQNHQGVAAYAAAHDYVELDEMLARETGHAPLVVLLDEVADPYNLGAILRTAEATGVQGVVIPKRRAVPLTETVGKAAAGAMEYVPVARVANLVHTIEQLKKSGYWIVGTDVDASHGYTEVDYKGPIAIVIGAEGKGLSRLVKEHCDYTVSLPMLGNLQSLNASVAAGVLLYEVVRQRR